MRYALSCNFLKHPVLWEFREGEGSRRPLWRRQSPVKAEPWSHEVLRRDPPEQRHRGWKVRDVIKLSVSSPEAGVRKGLVRPERPVGIETATQRKTLWEGWVQELWTPRPLSGFTRGCPACSRCITTILWTRGERGGDGRGLFREGCGENPAGSRSRSKTIFLYRVPRSCWRRCVGLVGLSLNLYPFQCPVNQHLTVYSFKVTPQWSFSPGHILRTE